MIVCATDIIVFEDKKVATLFNAGIGIVVSLFHNGGQLQKNDQILVTSMWYYGELLSKQFSWPVLI